MSPPQKTSDLSLAASSRNRLLRFLRHWSFKQKCFKQKSSVTEQILQADNTVPQLELKTCSVGLKGGQLGLQALFAKAHLQNQGLGPKSAPARTVQQTIACRTDDALESNDRQSESQGKFLLFSADMKHLLADRTYNLLCFCSCCPHEQFAGRSRN